MSEQAWKHKFVQALFELLRKATGLSEASCFKLAFEDVDTYWQNFSHYGSPEEAAGDAFDRMRGP